MRVEIKAFPDQPRKKGYLGNLGEATSQFLGALFFNLNCNLTTSAHCGYWEAEERTFLKHLRHPVNLIMSFGRLFRLAHKKFIRKEKLTETWIDHEHCKRAWENLV
jgi:hypothetical protein